MAKITPVCRVVAGRAAAAAGVGSYPHKEALLHSSSGECENTNRAGG